MSIDEYKFEQNDRKKFVLEFLAKESIVHNLDDSASNNSECLLSAPLDIESASDFLAQGLNVEYTIQWIRLHLYILCQNKRYNEIDLILQTNLLSFILPYANIEIEYSTLSSTLKILFKLSCRDQNENSPFLNLQFAENITEIIEKSEEMPTIRKKALKLVNNLLKDDNIGTGIFQNFIHCKIPSVLLSSNIIEQETFERLMEITKGHYYKVVAFTAELLGNLASYCKEDYLSIFASFYEIIAFYISNDFSNIDKDESILCNFLYLLSLMMTLDTNRQYAYSFQIPDIIIDNVLKRKKGIFIQYSYDIFYHIAENDGLFPFFQTFKFYNLTLNAIQENSSADVISSIVNAIGSIMPYDYENLFKNDIIAFAYDILKLLNVFQLKIKAILLLIRFFEIISNDPPFCIYILQNYSYLNDICFIIESLPNESILYFLNVFKSLIDEKSAEICEEVRQCKEAFNTLESLKNFENLEIANAAGELLNFWNDDNEE